MSYNSKYTGAEVENLLDQVASGNTGGGGGVTTETDPVFTASPAAAITDENISEWNNKQDAISDIETIREGAALGATALQGSDTGEEVDDVETLTSGSSINYDLNVKAVNHRGYSTESPENTIPAYIMSKAKGFTYVEGDVAFTSDNVAVLLHDATIDRTSDGSGDIGSMTYPQVMQYDFGSWFSEEYTGVKIPTFKEWILLCKNLGLHPYIELKSSGSYTQAQITQIVSEVEECGMKGKVTYISFNNTFLGYVKNADAYARLGVLANPLTSTKITHAKNLKNGTNDVFMDAKLSTVTSSLITSLMNNDIPLEVWTVNTESEILSMPSYISGVTSDYIIAGKVLYENSLTYVPPVVEYNPATAIELDQTSIELNTESVTLVATVTPSDTTDDIVWKSSDATIASVSDGVVTPLKNGSCTITVTAGSVSATCDVVVNIVIAATAIELNQTSISFADTNPITLVATVTPTNTTDEVVWTSSNDDLVKVEDGVVTPLIESGEGTCVITATAGSVSATCDVTINIIPATNVELSQTSITISDSTPVTLTATVTPENTTDSIVWESSNDGIASVDNGVVTPIKDGSCTITVTVGKVSASCSVAVENMGLIAATDITLDKTELVFSNLEPQTLTATVEPSDSTDEVVWSSSDDETATVEDGVVTPLKYGSSCVITATAGSVSADCVVTIEADILPIVDAQLANITDAKVVNNGSGGSTYDASVVGTYTSDDDGLHLVDGASVSIPYATSLTKSFTWVVKGSYDELHSSNAYQRMCRGDQDVPSAFYRVSGDVYCYKLTGNSAGTRKNYNDFPSWVSGQNNYQISPSMIGTSVHTYVWSYDADSNMISFYVDGVLAATQNGMKSYGKAASALCLGNNQTTSGTAYYANKLTIERCLIYDVALDEDKITELQQTI